MCRAMTVLSLSAGCCAGTVECVGLGTEGCSIGWVRVFCGVETTYLFVSSSGLGSTDLSVLGRLIWHLTCLWV